MGCTKKLLPIFLIRLPGNGGARVVVKTAVQVGRLVDHVAHAFQALQGIRCAVQAAAGDGAAGNQVAPQDLNEFDRRVLLEALRQARSLQQRLKTRFHMDI